MKIKKLLGLILPTVALGAPLVTSCVSKSDELDVLKSWKIYEREIPEDATCQCASQERDKIPTTSIENFNNFVEDFNALAEDKISNRNYQSLEKIRSILVQLGFKGLREYPTKNMVLESVKKLTPYNLNEDAPVVNEVIQFTARFNNRVYTYELEVKLEK